MADNLTVQSNPTVDSPPTDPLEALVAAYYQHKGYLTSSAKWFWVRDSTKQQRGYQDIDVLAVNSQETVIVSVSGNLDDKVRFDTKNVLQDKLLAKQLEYFSRVELYLNNVEEYKWLVSGRSIKRVIAYASGKPLAIRLNNDITWQARQIELRHVGEIIQELRDLLNDPEFRLKTNNQIVKLLQIISALDRDKSPKAL